MGSRGERDDAGMTKTLAYQITGSDTVRRWRFDELLSAGYDTADAFVLSGRSDIDLHAATALLRNGCPADLAIRILL